MQKRGWVVVVFEGSSGCVKPHRGYKLRQPGFIYGRRRVDGFEIPLDLIGEPGKRILNAVETLTKSFSSFSAPNLLLAPPFNVDDLALAVVNAVIYDDFICVFIIEQIKEAAAKVKV
ncbi:hypothetical protein NC653_008791 [Populus alba x Populus x berolinensis]|uniref:Uncharacterized protein n=1 Tax=Populus alba x Populus x berolinensis TaxID=444605 RepID=A0AAD6R7A4_9ROSI|nr:hypothetical protein NC653_008791 [Populus alba x Populus x berolinensis]